MPLADDVDLRKLAEMTEGYTGADIEALCREAALNAARENISTDRVYMRHFLAALEKVKPSIAPEQKREYERILTEFKRSLAYIS